MLCPAAAFLKCPSVPTTSRQTSCTAPQSVNNVWRATSTLATANTSAKQLRFASAAASVPRPVTIRQLWQACLASTLACSSCCSNKADDDTGHDTHSDAKANGERVGESTVMLDGVACSLVVICGRVLWRIGPEANGSLSTSRPYSLLVLTDTTGMVGVVQYHNLYYYNNNNSSTSDAAEEEEAVSVVQGTQDTGAQATSCATSERVNDAAMTCQGDKEEEEDTPAAATAASPEASRTAQQLPEQHTVNDNPTAMTADVSYIPDCETDIRLQDYVLCTGRLAFSDVDLDAQRYFAHVPAPIALDTTRMACEQEDKGNGRDADVSSATQSVAAEQQKTFVLLPGATVPMHIDELRSVLGTCSNSSAEGDAMQLPAGAIYMTEAEAHHQQQPGMTSEHTDDANTTMLTSRDARKTRGAPSQSGESTATLRFCVKGRVRLITEMNEMVYWSLTAIHTHLRLTRSGTQAEKTKAT